MITSNFTGNLGNHMFIYALTRTVAERCGYDWGFNPTPEFDYHKGKSQMDFLDIDYGKEHNYKYNETPPEITNIWREYYKKEHGHDYHPFQPDVFNVEDNTKLFIRCAQDARYYNKKILKQWFKIKEAKEKEYFSDVNEFGVKIENSNTVVLNVRGGEYLSVPSLLLNKNYWMTAMDLMKERIKDCRFLCVTDDEAYANRLFDFKVPVIHLSIGGDYYIINRAKNLILSNSSFAIFPTWLNENNPFVIAPRYWARYNISTGYWANSDIWTFGWNFLDRDGRLYQK